MNNLPLFPQRLVWEDTEPLECVSVLPEAPDTASFTFRAPSGALFDFLPGQFLTLELPLPGEPLQRTYTISSSPSRPLSITITAKAQPDSIGSRWLLENLKPGMRLKAYGPGGVFSHLNHPADKYLFLSAGSGITPMMSMTTYMFDFGDEPDVVFVNCARRPSEIIFRERLEQMARRLPGIDLKWVVESPDPYQPWTGFQGTINQLMLGLMAPDYLEREVFCCGPAPFMQAVREALQGLGFDMSRYHQESFQAPVLREEDLPKLEDPFPEEGALAEVSFASSGKSIRVGQAETLLAAARNAGLNIPSGCTFGICGTCKVKKLSGEVHMVHNGGISEEDIKAGYILACCSHPLGPVTLDV